MVGVGDGVGGVSSRQRRRAYQSDRPRGDLLADVVHELVTHGAKSREYARTYMRWYRATRPELRAADLVRLLAYRRALA